MNLRIKGTKQHLKYHRRRLKNKYKTQKCGFANFKRGLNCYYDCYNKKNLVKTKGSKKFQQKELFFEIMEWLKEK